MYNHGGAYIEAYNFFRSCLLKAAACRSSRALFSYAPARPQGMYAILIILSYAENHNDLVCWRGRYGKYTGNCCSARQAACWTAAPACAA